MNYVVFLSDTGSSCHVTVMGSLIVLVNKRADWNVPVSWILHKIHVTLQCIVVSVNTIFKVFIFKHSVILFRCSMICRWSEPWNSKPSYFRILYSFPSVYRPCFYFIYIWKHMTPFYWQQKLPDNRECIKIQEWLLKQSYVQRNI